MIIVAVLALAAVSIGLLLVAVALKSRSVATLNFMICLVAGVVLQPWSALAVHPVYDQDLRMAWIAALIGVLLFAASVLTCIYCFIITIEKKPSKDQKRQKRRKRRKKRRSRAQILDDGAKRESGGDYDKGDEGEEGDENESEVPPGRI